MTFKEYLLCKEPYKRPSFSVEVEKEDCFNIINHHSGFEVVLFINGEYFFYFRYSRDSKYTGLYTMDSDGNEKSASVFNMKNI